MLKKDARKIFKEKRRTVHSGDKMKWDDLLLIQFQKLSFPFISTVLSFYPIEENNEPDTFIITRYLQFKNPGINIAYPKTDLLGNSMQAIICDEDSLFEDNLFYVPEPVTGENIHPQTIDLVLVPLLAFDERGYRVGYGKGFYDRFLLHCRIDCTKVGLSYFEPLDAIDDADEFDVPLDFCITPQKVYVF